MTDHKWDVFVSHASEDKNEIADPLVSELKNQGIKVWYDKTELYLGDSLREKIDYGLSKSRFGVVILSKYFFQKEWPKKELNGLFSREIDGQKVILPIWHKVSKKDVISFSPILSDRFAINTSKGVAETARAIINTLGAPRRQSSNPISREPSELQTITDDLDKLAIEVQKIERDNSPISAAEVWRTEDRPYIESVIENILIKYVDKGLLITFTKCNFDDFIQFYIDQYKILGDPDKTGGIWGIRLQLLEKQFTLKSWTFMPSQNDSISEKSVDYISADDIFSSVLDTKLLNLIKKIIGVE